MAESLRLTADGDFHPFRTEHKAREEELLPGQVFLDECDPADVHTTSSLQTNL